MQKRQQNNWKIAVSLTYLSLTGKTWTTANGYAKHFKKTQLVIITTFLKWNLLLWWNPEIDI